jgi:AcrR family transcriptional regulator
VDPTKARLLDAAGEEFAEKGFEGATVRSICQRAGANLAAVNYYFGDKERLYVAAVIEAHRCGVELPAGPDLAVREPAEQLHRYLRHFLESVLAVHDQGGWHHALMLREMMRPTAAAETLVREVIRPKFEGLLKIISALRPDLEGRQLTATAFSVIGQCLFYRVGRNIAVRLIGADSFAELDAAFLADHIRAFTLAALGQDSAQLAVGGEGPCTGSH